MGTYPWGPHGPQSGPNQVTPNPTPAYVPPPPAASYAPPVYGASGAAYGAGNSVPYTGPIGPRRKSYIFALILTFLFGPLGLFYASKKAALVVLFILFALPVTLSALGMMPGGWVSHPFAILDHDSIMEQVWSLYAFISIVWSVIAVNRFNASEKAKS